MDLRASTRSSETLVYNKNQLRREDKAGHQCCAETVVERNEENPPAVLFGTQEILEQQAEGCLSCRRWWDQCPVIQDSSPEQPGNVTETEHNSVGESLDSHSPPLCAMSRAPLLSKLSESPRGLMPEL